MGGFSGFQPHLSLNTYAPFMLPPLQEPLPENDQNSQDAGADDDDDDGLDMDEVGSDSDAGGSGDGMEEHPHLRVPRSLWEDECADSQPEPVDKGDDDDGETLVPLTSPKELEIEEPGEKCVVIEDSPAKTPSELAQHIAVLQKKMADVKRLQMAMKFGRAIFCLGSGKSVQIKPWRNVHQKNMLG